MNLFVLNLNLDEETVLDSYNSLIWTDRYNEYGDFEIYTAMDPSLLDFIRQDHYLRREDSEHVMIIESIKITSDVEEGDLITVTGRSLESILDRRVIWGQKSVSGNLQDAIKTLLNECIISPSNVSRKIDNFIFEASDDPVITSLTIEAQYTGDNLYEVIQKICAEREIGFKVTLNEQKQFVFKLYSGVDRSYDQLENPYVIFSPSYDNLISANYLESKQAWKNVTLVGGEGEGSARKYTGVGNTKGLFRRELFTDARDISSDLNDGGKISDTEYTKLLRQRGKEKLSENVDIVSFEGQAETSILFKYGVDFSNGDIVQVADAYGHEVRARIVEIVASQDEEGLSVYPTFSTLPLQEDLPDGYLELEYIESSGTQYIDTGFKPNQNTKIIMEFAMVDGASDYALFGSQDSATVSMYRVLNRGSTFKVTFGASALDFRDYGVTPTQKTKLEFGKGSIRIGDMLDDFNDQTFQGGYSCMLFAASNGSSVSWKAKMRLYSCQIYDNDFLIRNFMPCKNESDVVGLYDIVNKKFYTNAGTGAFVAG